MLVESFSKPHTAQLKTHSHFEIKVKSGEYKAGDWLAIENTLKIYIEDIVAKRGYETINGEIRIIFV